MFFLRGDCFLLYKLPSMGLRQFMKKYADANAVMIAVKGFEGCGFFCILTGDR